MQTFFQMQNEIYEVLAHSSHLTLGGYEMCVCSTNAYIIQRQQYFFYNILMAHI